MLGIATMAQVAGPIEGTLVDVSGANGEPPGSMVLDVHVDGPGTACGDGDEDAVGHDEMVVLVSGLGSQRIAWPPELRDRLHAAGYRTVTVDNRDVGRSTVLPGEVLDLPVGDDGWPAAVYNLEEMAADLVAVLDHLEATRAHVVGLSMGGMIAQHLAFDHPDRVATLTSVMSNTGHRDTGQADPEAGWVLTTPTPSDHDAYLAHAIELARAIGSPGHLDEARVLARAEVTHARGIHPAGTARQLLAIRADRDRTGRLAGVRAPTLVVHGTADPLIGVSGGHATAAAIDGAQLELVEGMGHDLPVALLEEVTRPLLSHLATHPVR